MAAAIANVTVKNDNYTYKIGRFHMVLGNVVVTPSPATYTTGGILMPLNTPLIKAQRAPVLVRFTSGAVQTGQGVYGLNYIFGSNNTNGLLKIFSAGVELTGGSAIPAGISGDTIQVEVYFFGQN